MSFLYPEIYIGGWNLVLLWLALVQVPFWMWVSAPASEALTIPLPGLTFHSKDLNLLAQLFPFILNSACACCLLLLFFIFAPGRDVFFFFFISVWLVSILHEAICMLSFRFPDVVAGPKILLKWGPWRLAAPPFLLPCTKDGWGCWEYFRNQGIILRWERMDGAILITQERAAL